MSSKPEVWQGTLALMILKTLESTGSLHGYGIARRIEQTSANLAKFYQLTRAGRKQIAKETRDWEQISAILARFLIPQGGMA
jgi:DNA-binding PadR family transcriptional regulator